MTTEWIHHHSPRAVVPTAQLLQTRDIESASTCLAENSPSSFGIGISRVQSDTDSIPYPLYYVSPRAAADRSPKTHPRNAPGVHTGWYVVASPGEKFELLISMLQGGDSVHLMPRVRDVIVANVHVDGARAGSYVIVPGEQQDICVKGYAHSFHTDNTSSKQFQSVSRFKFCKAQVSETGRGVGNGYGSIKMTLATARMGHVNQETAVASRRVSTSTTEMSEKAAVKGGISIAVVRDGETISTETTEASFTTYSERPVAQARIVIFIRELFWLQSRRILDDEGKPVKYVERDETEPEVIEVLDDDKEQVSVVGERVRKRARYHRERIICLE